MTKLIGKTWFATSVGIITGVAIMTISILFQSPSEASFPVVETVMVVEQEEVKSEQRTLPEMIEEALGLTQQNECIEIIEYDMTTGTKTTIGCAEKELR